MQPDTRRFQHQEPNMGHTVEFKRPDGQAVKGYLAEAANPVASVVVIQE